MLCKAKVTVVAALWCTCACCLCVLAPFPFPPPPYTPLPAFPDRYLKLLRRQVLLLDPTVLPVKSFSLVSLTLRPTPPLPSQQVQGMQRLPYCHNSPADPLPLLPLQQATGAAATASAAAGGAALQGRLQHHGVDLRARLRDRHWHRQRDAPRACQQPRRAPHVPQPGVRGKRLEAEVRRW